jgi:hypothetical protein
MLRLVENVSFGCDPELFLERNGRIVGSEKVIPESGLRGGIQTNPLVVRDGVQVELNPAASTNFRVLGRTIGLAFEVLERHLLRFGEGTKINYSGVVDVDQDELDTLGERSRILGCLPSKNYYGIRPIDEDAKKGTMRSAGGHLHIGLKRNYDASLAQLFADREELIPLLDIFVGNTCVLLDRDPLASVRRQNYGRAGEFRDPDHGIEYRTLSNFWLKSYALMTFVFGMANVAISTLAGRHLSEICDAVDIGDVIKAIETNNFELALENFKTVRSFLVQQLPDRGFPLCAGTLDKFVSFAKDVNEYSLDKYFRLEPKDHWQSTDKTDFADFIETIY